MPQTKLLSSNCVINYKTQEIQSACNPYSKIVEKNTQKFTRGQLVINTELVTEAFKAANMKHNIHWNMDDNAAMSPVLESAEEDMPDMSTDEVRTDETVETEIDYELEPPRPELLSVRRRSRQFYPSTGETKEIKQKETKDEPLKKVPVFNLGRSLKKLYSQQNNRQTDDEVDTGGHTAHDHPLEYDSDSGLLSKVKVYRPLRKIQSLPEMSHYGLTDETADFGMEPADRSASITSLTKNWKQQNLDVQKGPGYVFLAAVADNLRDKQAKTVALRADMSLVKGDKHKPTTAKSASTDLTKPQGDNLQAKPVEMRPVSATVLNVDHMEDKSKKSVFTSVFEWGTKSKSSVSNKELNLYSPVSF